MRDSHPRRLGLRPGLPAFLLGFLAASLQIYLLREFAAAFTGNELTFGLVLGSWLLWGGIGSLVRPGRPEAGAPARLARLYGAAIVLFYAALTLLRFSHKLLGLLPSETAGLAPAFGFALVLAGLLSFPLGRAFVLNARLADGDVAKTYVLESAGAAAAGLAVQLLLVPRLSNWQGAAMAGGAAALMALLALRPRRAAAPLAAALVLSAGLALADRTALEAAWRPFELVDAEDSPYGQLVVVRAADQVTLYDNGLAVFSRPDPGAAEDAVHFALLQRETAGRILLIGGAAGGAVEEVLKYPGATVDGVELDPAVLRLARRHLPAAASAALDGPRVRLFARDGRDFLERAAGPYDAVLLGLPDPATTQVNRYYTREFFTSVKAKLGPGGVLGFALTGGENYLGEATARLLASVVRALEEVFPGGVRLVPGDRVVILASEGPLTLDAAALSARLDRIGLSTTYVSPAMLPFRLDPGRIERLNRTLASVGREAGANRDLVPVSTYFQAQLWASQFAGPGRGILDAAAEAGPFWLLDLPLVAAAVVLLVLALAWRRAPSRSLVPVAVMGFTTIVVEVCLFIAFQANFGSVYGQVPLLLAAFMAGLVAGGALGRRRRRPGRADLPLVQAGFVLLLAATPATLRGTGGEVLTFGLLGLFGLLGGFLFVAANRIVAQERPHPGLAYGVDLVASFAGAVLAAALFIPLFGIPALILRLAFLNALCGLFLLVPARPA
ncbi:MAG: hypothetical protein MUE80_01000 [Acidobacteria bacterium]|jgi:spermidine synthase|nr:hypothetical protein [Acidobacteriota bacterium]